MKSEMVAGKLHLKRSTEEKAPFVQRLARVEGQVRGLRQMIDDNRFCGDEIQQANAIIAATREVALLLISQQLKVQVTLFADQNDGNGSVQEFVELLRSTFRLQ